MKITEIEAQITDLNTQKAKKVTEVRALATAEDSKVEDVQKGLAEVDDFDKQIETSQAEL